MSMTPVYCGCNSGDWANATMMQNNGYGCVGGLCGNGAPASYSAPPPAQFFGSASLANMGYGGGHYGGWGGYGYGGWGGYAGHGLWGGYYGLHGHPSPHDGLPYYNMIARKSAYDPMNSNWGYFRKA